MWAPTGRMSFPELTFTFKALVTIFNFIAVAAFVTTHIIV